MLPVDRFMRMTFRRRRRPFGDDDYIDRRNTRAPEAEAGVNEHDQFLHDFQKASGGDPPHDGD